MFREQDLICLVNSFGQDLTLISKSNSSYDTTTGKVSTPEEDIPVKGYFSDYKTQDMDAINIRYGDRKLLLSSRNLLGNTYPKPQEGDSVTGQEGEVFVVCTQEILSQGSTICYICQVRQ